MSDLTERLLVRGARSLAAEDAGLATLLEAEISRQQGVLSLVAASSLVDPSVLAAMASVGVNVTAEGYPGHRFHAGCDGIDPIEEAAVERAKEAFGARWANVQVHSATTANQLVMCSLLRPGDTLMGLHLDAGGHLTHGAPPTLSGTYFNAVAYGVDADGRLDYEAIADLAREHRPRLIVCGTTAYPRKIDFERFRAIADNVDALLLADITHVAGLVAAGRHPSSIDAAHVTTTCTHKQLYGPRGGLLLAGRDAERPLDGGSTLAEHLDRAVFPFFQGAPDLSSIAGKAAALEQVRRPQFRDRMQRVRDSADTLAAVLTDLGHRVVSGGTENHLVIVDVGAVGLTGVIAERALEACDVLVNRNRIPGDTRPATVASGIRLGTNGIAHRGLGREAVERCARLVDRVLRSVEARGESRFDLPDAVARETRREVAALCGEHPVPGYPVPDEEA